MKTTKLNLSRNEMVQGSVKAFFFLKCFRVTVVNELNEEINYDIILNHSDIDNYVYEIWKYDSNIKKLIKTINIPLSTFRKYYFADENSTHYKIINELLIEYLK